MKKNFEERVSKAVKTIRQVSLCQPKVGLILGSGLSSVVKKIDGVEIPYTEIEGMHVGNILGHLGVMKLNEEVCVFAGRVHFYEGTDEDDIVLNVAIMKDLGVKQVIVTNAAGAVNKAFVPGDVILLKDHINNMGFNPLKGANIDGFGPRFPDLSDAYNRGLRSLLKDQIPQKTGYSMKEGVYMAFNGPSYETPAEVRMAGLLGADLVGMSTVPEVIVANYLGMKVVGYSCATNMAAGMLDQPLSHDEVMSTSKMIEDKIGTILLATIEILSKQG